MIPNGMSKLGRKFQDTHPDEGLFCHIQAALACYSIFVHIDFDQDTWEHQLYVDTFCLSLGPILEYLILLKRYSLFLLAIVTESKGMVSILFIGNFKFIFFMSFYSAFYIL